jgi:hypothetical protein
MRDSRADQILAEWHALAGQARRPAIPRSGGVRVALAGSGVGAAVIVILALAVAAVWLAPRETGLPGGIASPSPSPLLGSAPWWVDPADLPVPADAQVIRGFIREDACANGDPPVGRVLEPTIEYGAESIVITYRVQTLPAAECPTNPAFPVTLHLREPVGGRQLLDGTDDPPRDATIDPMLAPAPAIDCGPADEAECRLVIGTTVLGLREPYATIRIERYVPGCIRARLCMPGRGGYDAKYLVVATERSGYRLGWKCSVEGTEISCRAAPREDVEELATMVVQEIGVGRQDVLLHGGGTTWSWPASIVPFEQPLTVGSWLVATSDERCDNCQSTFPPFTQSISPGWCTQQFDATAGARIVVTITIPDDGPCRIDVSS